LNKLSWRILIAISSVLVMLIVSLPGCFGSGSSSKIIQVEFRSSGSPDLNKPIELTAKFTLFKGYPSDAHNVSAKIILPAGFEKVDGDLEWQGDIIQGTPKTMQAIVKAIKTGDWEIIAQAFFDPSPNQHLGDSTRLYASVSESGGQISDRPFDTYPTHITVSTPGTYSPSVSLTPITPAGTSISPTSPVTSSSNNTSLPQPVYPFSELRYKPFEDLAIQADCITVADVTTAKAERSLPGDKFQGWVYTTFTLTIDKLIKGDVGIKEVFIRLPGGIINDEVGYSNAPWMQGVLSLEDKVLVGLKKEDNGYYSGLPWGLPWARKPDGYEYVMTLDTGERLTLQKLLGIMIQTMLANNIPVALPPSEFPPIPMITTFPFSPDPSPNNGP
jgi:hypothetical protein